jgi:hypothetical protein
MQLLTAWALASAGTPMDENGKKICLRYSGEQVGINEYINLLSVIGVLVAAVSFTAGLTVPGGFNSSDYGPAGQGIATSADQWMFQVFIICNIIAMSFFIIGSFILLWSQLRDIIADSLQYALFFLLVALFALSSAFIFAVCLVVSKIHWLWYLVLLLGLFLLGSLLTLSFLWWFPFWIPHPVCRRISNYAIPFMLRFTESYSKDKQQESQSANKSPSYLALCVRCMNEMTEIRIAERMKNVEASKSKDKQEESQAANKFPNYLALCVGCMNEMHVMRIAERMKNVEASNSKEGGWITF